MELKTQLNKNGRIIVPAKIRKALNLHPGDELIIRLEHGSIRLIPLHQAVLLAQQKVKQYVPDNISLVEDLLQARREEQ